MESVLDQTKSQSVTRLDTGCAIEIESLVHTNRKRESSRRPQATRIEIARARAEGVVHESERLVEYKSGGSRDLFGLHVRAQRARDGRDRDHLGSARGVAAPAIFRSGPDKPERGHHIAVD